MIGGALNLAEKGVLPDAVIRFGIRRLLTDRLKELHDQDEPAETVLRAFCDELDQHDIAEATDAANEQHYEVPTALFQIILGPHLKYSSCLFETADTTLPEAEAHMLGVTCERAELADGHDILELGCGWGSLSLWMAEHYPNARITAVSNSLTQAVHIREMAAARGLANLEVVTCDINVFEPGKQFDRIVSVEMFEHVRNYRQLFGKVANWLNDSGKLFIHVFAHETHPYLFEDRGDADWMARHFFSGGTMPSHALMPRVAEGFKLEQDWRINGTHYARTLRSWLDLLDGNRPAVEAIMAKTYGEDDATRWLNRWRIFIIASEELFAFRSGQEWGVSHYRFSKATG